MSEDMIYLDYAATAPLRPEALAAMEPYLTAGRTGMTTQANPNSLHSAGRAAFRALEEARAEVAKALGAARPDEVVFTSGATEADNAAIAGLTFSANRRMFDSGKADSKAHVIVSAIEHDAVLCPARHLAYQGFEVDFIKPTRAGFVDVEAVRDAFKPNTVLVSVQAANSEVGSVQPVRQLADLAHAHGALFHTDATQALGKVPVDVRAWDCDAASFSAHKIGGPKGCGALYLRARTPMQPQALGGGQEGSKRSGTQDVCSIVGFAAALRTAVAHQQQESARLMRLRDRIYGAVQNMARVVPTVPVEAGSLDYLPNIVNLMVPGIESNTLVLRFDMLGIEVSGASACASNSLEPSHVLRALGISDDEAQCELRASMGWDTTDADVEAFLDTLPRVIEWRR
ncbi:cysteine desulfurase family protein [Adlercreutzia murintestinalis]|uniref:cysteine desulfurase family protein n=1 Tax=Adlercreutzia murintestinalis TaxID=2941325 RepID=UPI00203A97A0|nr:cysteine desulfurase family protein [Adlercreutzia murintestinalis]